MMNTPKPGKHSSSSKRPEAILLAAMLSCSVPAFGAQTDTELQPSDINDNSIALAIEADLSGDESVDSYFIDVGVAKGIVTLDGRVSSLLAKERAVALARAIRGVQTVKDNLRVSGVHRPDRSIQQDVKSALFEDPATDSYQLEVEAKDGTVILKGNVESWAERQLAEEVAKSIAGVQSIDNQIRLDYRDDRPDKEILHEVQRRIQSDVYVENDLIEVEVEDGKVTLKGTVGSAAEKSRAQTLAWVTGVDGIKNKLKVDIWANDLYKRDRSFIKKGDKDLKAILKSVFRSDTRVKPFNPDIHVNSGIVTLTGVVDNLRAKQTAEQIAKNTVGVVRVINYLKVRPDSFQPDAVVERAIKDALFRDVHVDRYDVDVDVVDGWAYLGGRVYSHFAKQRIATITSSVPGVTRVWNNLDVDYDPDALKSDWELTMDVQKQLFWSPFVDSDDVDVSVDSGVVTLSGYVDSAMERLAAEENAYDAGAVDVRNQLMIGQGG